jgi:amidase
MLNSIAGFDRRDPTSLRETVPNYLEPLGKEIKGIRIGVDQDYCTAGVDAEVTKAVLAAAKVFVGLGGDIREVKVRSIRDAIMAQHTIFAAEAAAAHERTYPSRALEYGAKFRGILEKGVNTRGLDYAKAYATRQDVTYQFEMLFDEVDLLLCPSMAMTLSLQDFPPYEGPVAEETLLALHQVTAPFSLLGNPTISIPCGFNSQGLPLSLQLVGRHGEESLMMQVAHAYEQSTEWHETRPPCTCQREPREHA